MSVRQRLFLYTLLILFLGITEGKKKKAQKESPETTLFHFLRLFVFRLIYGFASMIGAEDGISDFMGGILVPPAVEDADYRDYIETLDETDY